jgi:hypothetical protein
MTDAQFGKAIVVARGGRHLTIRSIYDAIEFLEEWPVEDRGLAHEVALGACYAAHDGRRPVEAAKRALAGWARREGILESCPPAPPWMTEPKLGSASIRPR